MVSGTHERSGFARLLATDGPTVFGTWVKLATLETVELLGHAGFDFVEIVAVEGLRRCSSAPETCRCRADSLRRTPTTTRSSRGFRFVMVSNDTTMFGTAARALRLAIQG
jgi:2-keto-3-deoxy-L-rhamnonate aldolase RhmA